MNFLSVIHQCRTAREREAATAVDRLVSRENKYRPPNTHWDFRERLQTALHANGLTETTLHEVPLNGRVDVIRNGRTIMSWTPTI